MPDLKPGYNLIRVGVVGGWRHAGARIARNPESRDYRINNLWIPDPAPRAGPDDGRTTKRGSTMFEKGCWRESGYWSLAAAPDSVPRWDAASSNSAPN